jgi:hypothetical protein
MATSFQNIEGNNVAFLAAAHTCINLWPMAFY